MFGFDEGGLYDSVDYVLEQTGQDSLHYGCHSMGCTQYLIMLASLPEYNDKIKLGVLLAPPAYMSHSVNIIFQLAAYANDIEILYHLFGYYVFFPHTEVISWFAHLYCSDDHPDLQTVCMNIAFNILGFTPEQLNGTMIPTYLDHVPAGTSTRPFVHYAQLYISDKFESFDFGEDNFAHYGQDTPVTYDLSKVTAATAVFKGDGDSLTAVEDIDRLVSELPNVVFDHLVEFEGWTHLDYFAAMDADQLVYSYVLDLMSNF